MGKYIIREVPAEQTDFSFYFDDDGLKGDGSNYCYNLFIVAQSRNSSGFNTEVYQELQNEIENLIELYSDIVEKSQYAEYSSVGSMLFDYGLINKIHNTKRIKMYTNFLKECCEKPKSPYANHYNNFSAHNEELTAKYLTIKTGKKWSTDSAYGYCQGDCVEMVFCEECYSNGVKHYGEIWLGAAKEFCVITLDEEGEEQDSCYGYIVSDCQAIKDEDYKKLVCEWACVSEEETKLEMVDGCNTYTLYSYRTA